MDSLIGLVTAALPVLLLLACPAAMYLLMRSGMGHAGQSPETRAMPPGERLQRLEREQEHLAKEIARARGELAERSPREVGREAPPS